MDIKVGSMTSRKPGDRIVDRDGLRGRENPSYSDRAPSSSPSRVSVRAIQPRAMMARVQSILQLDNGRIVCF